VITGSFDPFTCGHQYLLDTARRFFDTVYLTVFINSEKAEFFSRSERLDMLKAVAAKYKNVYVDSYDGLVVDWCRQNNVRYIVRGVRSPDDYEYEKAMAEYNYREGNVVTLFVNGVNEISSREVRKRLKSGEDISGLVPSEILSLLRKKQGI